MLMLDGNTSDEITYDDKVAGSKHPRSATTNSATSRKNKLQRCSVCGGLGHKSRTCEQALSKANEMMSEQKYLFSPEMVDPRSDPRTVLAAYGLLNLASQPSPGPTKNSLGRHTNTPASIMPPRSPSHMISSHWQPLSPSLCAI